MKLFTASLINSLHGRVGTFTRVIIINPVGLPAIRLTELAHPIVIHGSTYYPAKGISISSITTTINEASARIDVDITADPEGSILQIDDLRNGLYKNALIRVYVIDHENPELLDLEEQTENIIFAGNMGDIEWNDQYRAKIECEGMLSQANGIVLEKYSPACRTDFGDRRCRVPIYGHDPIISTEYLYGDFIRQRVGTDDLPSDYPPFVWMCSNPGVSSNTIPTLPVGPAGTVIDWGTAEFTCMDNPYLRYGTVGHFTQAPEANRLWIDIIGGNPTDDDHWQNGVIIFQTGPLKGVSYEIRKSTTHVIHTFLPFEIKPEEGDWFEIVPGCDHSPGPKGCARYDNILNYRGEPWAPNKDIDWEVP